ncbi:unnamed protein product [Cylindrotheca closterium]|uniref:Uncharacterized protein n=1 Tax=Cylindrotheca closterium TaxID=2856 RepID=A0AAD2JPC9_9STRA|nr:unnamed protein product [Cylindrotheca closterium]
MSSAPAWKKATEKEQSVVYLEEEEDDIAALFFGDGGGGATDDNDSEEEEEDAAALYFAEQEAKAKADNEGAQDDESSSSSSSSSSDDGSNDSSSRKSDNSGSSSGDDDSSQKENNDDASRSSHSNSSRGSENAGNSASGSDSDDRSQRSDGSSRSGSGSEEEIELSEDDDRSRSDESSRQSDDESSRRSDRSERSSRSGSQSENDDGSRSKSSDSGSERDDSGDSASDDGSRSTRSSRSSTSKNDSDSDNGSRSKRSDGDGTNSDASSRSSKSGSKASADDESAQGSNTSSDDEVEVSSDTGRDDTKGKDKEEIKEEEKRENAKPASTPAPFPKPINTKPVKSFPKVATTIPTTKAPDVKAKPAFIKSEDGLAPWQSELKKRKETGASLPGWKKPKKEESTIYVEDDEDDIAALFFESAGGKPKSAKFSIGGAGQNTTGLGNDDDFDAAAMFQSAGGQAKAATEHSNEDDAAAMFQSGRQTEAAVAYSDDDDAAAMFQSGGQTEAPVAYSNDDDAAAMFRSTEPTKAAEDSFQNHIESDPSEYATAQTENQEPDPMPANSGDEEFVEVWDDEGDAGDEEVLEEVEIVEDVEEDGGAYTEEEMIVEVEEEFVDDETVGTSNEQEIERRFAHKSAYDEMDKTESQMRNYIASLAHGESARSLHSDQSSVPWGMPTIGDDDNATRYAGYVQAARERRMDDQSSFFRPDVEMPTDNSIADTETFASSEQRSIPWGLEVREIDSWANPVRRLQPTKKSEAKEDTDTINKESTSVLSTKSKNAETAPTISRKAPKGKKRRAPTGVGEMVSAEVYKTSVPNPERETELWYHPGFAFLSQNPNMGPYYAPPPPKISQSNSMNESEGTDKAIVSDLEVAQYMYNTNVPAISKVTLLSYGQETISQWNKLDSFGRRRDDQSLSTSSESTEVKLPDLSKTIMRTASAWTPNGRDDSEASSESLSYDMLVPFDDEGSDEDKRRNVVFSRSGSSVSIDLEVETFEYVPESSLSLRPESESTLESSSVKSTRGRLPCGIYGFVSCCFFLVLIPTTVALVLLMTGQNNEVAPRTTNNNFTSPTGAPSMAPTLLNEIMEDTSDAPSSGPPLPTMQPTVFDPVVEEPVTEDLLFRLLASASVDNGEALRNRRSPQFAAMEWLRTPAGFSGVSNDAVFLQRYALATFYYSTSGESWTENDLWLSEADVCEWFSSGGSLLCNNDGQVTALTLTNNGLDGNLPNEIGILSRLETIMLSGNTQLIGSVPRTLQNLSNLRSIFIEGTGLSALPPEVCDLPLQDFWANCEELGCTCCNECFF